MDIDANTLENALDVLGQRLADKDHHYEIVAIGGGGLLLIGQLIRMTKDLDLIALVESDEFISANPLPKNLLDAINEIGLALGLGKEWINPGPASLLATGLPEGFKSRLQTRYYGGLTVHLAGRFDQICFKLYASVDQGPQSKHFADLKFLNPTEPELKEAQRWCLTQDVSREFSKTLNEVLECVLVSK